MDRNNRKAFIGVAIIFAVTVLLIFRDSILPPDGFSDSSVVVQHLPLGTESVKSNTASMMITQLGGSATSGHLFKGEKKQSFNKNSLKFNNYQTDSVKNFQNQSRKSCTKWSVVTTIFEPSDAVKRQASIEDWCLVVVGDKKGPFTYPLQNRSQFVFLKEEHQLKLSEKFSFIKRLPWNHFGRKNVGFFYAIMNGARQVWDFDDDNEYIQKNMIDITSEADTKGIVNVLTLPTYNMSVFNPYPIMSAPHLPSWPRGIPLQSIKPTNTEGIRNLKLEPTQIPLHSIGIIQSLANHDPDMDAIYRLVQPIPFTFYYPRKKATADASVRTSRMLSFSSYSGKRNLEEFVAVGEVLKHSIAVPEKSYSPYNAQATLHLYSSLWSLYLPVTVHGRVSDIWRGYIFQKVAKNFGIKLLFAPPLVRQDRNVHNYLADFNSESDLYLKSEQLVRQLELLTLKCSTLPGQLEELYVYMYEHDYLGLADVEIVQQWIQALIDVKYSFPTLSKRE